MSVRIQHREGIAADVMDVWEVIADFRTWPEWNPLVPSISGALGFKAPLSLTETLPGEPPRQATVTVTDWTPGDQLVWLDRRGWASRSRRYFELESLAPGACILANGEIFEGWRGQAFARRHARALREGFEAINTAIKARLQA